MDVVVFGAGSLGSLLGGMLAREHAVTLVGRRDHVEAVDRDGLQITGTVDERVHPAATTDGRDLRGDLAVVTVKAFHVETAGRDLATGGFDAAVPFTNGMGNEGTLAAHLDCPVLGGTATYGAVLREPGRVECTGRGEVTVGAREGGPSPVAEKVGRAFDRAGIDAAVAGDMPRRLREKLAVNAGINAVTALARVENGRLRSAPADELAEAAARETARVARAEGVDLSDREAVEAVRSVAAATADNASSMYQDVREGRRTEVDAINGYVLERARENDVEVPVNRVLTGLLRTWEAGRGLR